MTNILPIKPKKELRANPYTEDILQKQIKDCMQVLNTYGKKDFDYFPVLKVFIERLGHYEPERIKEAFNEYIRNKANFPTPSDIIDILERKIRPDSAVYQKLLKQRRDGSYLTNGEERYIREYEKHVLNEQ